VVLQPCHLRSPFLAFAMTISAQQERLRIQPNRQRRVHPERHTG
jgi:hypothetical protein